MSETLNEILNSKPLKKMQKLGCNQRKESHNSTSLRKNSGQIHKKKELPPIYSRQSIMDLLPHRSRGRPTKMDMVLRTALKNKKFNFAT
jgi:hypothetical protein